MKVFALINTDYGMENCIIGIFSSEILAKEYAIKYCTPVDGEMSDDDRLSLSLMKTNEHELDIKFYDVFNPDTYI